MYFAVFVWFVCEMFILSTQPVVHGAQVVGRTQKDAYTYECQHQEDQNSLASPGRRVGHLQDEAVDKAWTQPAIMCALSFRSRAASNRVCLAFKAS